MNRPRLRPSACRSARLAGRVCGTFGRTPTTGAGRRVGRMTPAVLCIGIAVSFCTGIPAAFAYAAPCPAVSGRTAVVCAGAGGTFIRGFAPPVCAVSYACSPGVRSPPPVPCPTMCAGLFCTGMFSAAVPTAPPCIFCGLCPPPPAGGSGAFVSNPPCAVS